MKVSTISHEVVLLADVQAAAARSGSGKPATKISDPEKPETATHHPLAAQVKPAVEMIINGVGLGLKFLYDRDADVRVIQVVDEASGDIIRQIPPDEVVDFMRQFNETKGRFVSLRF
jgi:flagellar protein FlaG